MRAGRPRGPLLGVLLVVGLLPLAIDPRLETPDDGQRSVLQIGAFAALLVTLVCMLLRGSVTGRRLRPLGIDLVALALALGSLAMVLSAALSDAPALSLATSLLWFSGVALFLTLRAVSRPLFLPLSALLTVQAAVLSAYAIAQVLGLELLPNVSAGLKSRATATLGHPNFLASLLGPLLFVVLARAVDSRHGFSWTAARVAVPLVVVALALTKARAIFLGVLVGLVVTAVLMLLRLGRRRTAAGALAFAFCAAVLVPGAAPRLVDRVMRGTDVESRLHMWTVAASLHAASSPLGIGAGGFQRHFWEAAARLQEGAGGRTLLHPLLSFTDSEGRAVDPEHVHNDYLEMWAESGYLGLFAHLLLVLYAGFFASRAVLAGGEGAPRVAFLLGALVTSCVDSVFGFPLAHPCSLSVFWCVLALILEVVEPPAAESAERDVGKVGRALSVVALALASLGLWQSVRSYRGELLLAGSGIEDDSTRTEALRLSPTTWKPLLALAVARGKAGDFEGARVPLDEALRRHAPINGLFLRSVLLAETGHAEEAVARLEMLRLVVPSNRFVVEALARIAEKTDPARAQALRDELDRFWPDRR